MAGVSAADVKNLRTRTGAGMMDCKRALTDAGGDPERATDLLRERGLAQAGKRAGRATSEGVIAIAREGSAASIIELGCETDFVARADEYQALSSEIAQRITQTGMRLMGLYGSLDRGSKYAPLNEWVMADYLNAISFTIRAGTSEIQRNIIANRGLGLPRG